MTHSLIVVAAALVASLATPAVAGSVVVPTGDLNLATTQGQSALNQRVERAAKRVCPIVDYRDLKALAWSNNCRSVALASANPQIASHVARAQTRMALAGSTDRAGT